MVCIAICHLGRSVTSMSCMLWARQLIGHNVVCSDFSSDGDIHVGLQTLRVLNTENTGQTGD
ncbi:hypothetical protein BD414DRAFT_496551 [Trametes punicea]|nr:hypothetical protein BD414DRAFT_496551 [Trametes punicea]